MSEETYNGKVYLIREKRIDDRKSEIHRHLVSVMLTQIPKATPSTILSRIKYHPQVNTLVKQEFCLDLVRCWLPYVGRPVESYGERYWVTK